MNTYSGMFKVYYFQNVKNTDMSEQHLQTCRAHDRHASVDSQAPPTSTCITIIAARLTIFQAHQPASGIQPIASPH